MPRWFRRFGDIPGVAYNADPRVDRSKLSRHDDVPKRQTYTSEGKQHESLSWPVRGGTTSASPAQDHAPKDDSTASLLRYVSEVLELPGQASDYHFAVQRVIEDLWKRRREERDVLPELERLCWLDIRLIETAPEAISSELSSADADGRPIFVRVLAFSHLVYLYEREGLLHEALDVAERAKRFEQGEDDCTRLQERIAQLRSYDAS